MRRQLLTKNFRFCRRDSPKQREFGTWPDTKSRSAYFVLQRYPGILNLFRREAADGYRVVATVSVEGGAPLRFVATLGEGQQVTISTPGKSGEADRELMISRDAGTLILSDPIPETALATPQ